MKRVLFNSDIFKNGTYEEAKGEFEDPENCFDGVCQLACDWTNDDWQWFKQEFPQCFKETTQFIGRKERGFTPYGDFYKNVNRVGYKPFLSFDWCGYCDIYSLKDEFNRWDSIEVTDENGHLWLRCADHDATIWMEVKQLTDLGSDMLERWYDQEGKLQELNEYEILDKIWNDSHYSHLPRLADQIFGKPENHMAA